MTSAIILQTPQLRVVCLPSHGMLVTELVPRAVDRNLLWSREQGPLHDFEQPALPTATGDPFDTEVFAGGWFGMFPNAGIPGAHDLGEMLHGTFPRHPWRVQEQNQSMLRCSLRVDGFSASRVLSVSGAEVTMRTEVCNTGSRLREVSFGEHPCLDRQTFAGGRVRLEARRSFIVREVSEPGSNRFAPGQQLDWPLAMETDGSFGRADLVPERADGSHDHIGIELAAPKVSVDAPELGGRLELDVQASATPYLLFWRHFAPPASPWGGDVFGLETMSTPGRTRDDARSAGALTTLEPGRSLAWSLRLQWSQGFGECDKSPHMVNC